MSQSVEETSIKEKRKSRKMVHKLQKERIGVGKN